MNNPETIAFLFTAVDNDMMLSKEDRDELIKRLNDISAESSCTKCKVKTLADARSQAIREFRDQLMEKQKHIEYYADKFKRECEKYDHLSDDYGQLKESYDILEQKYWDSQRLIDKYERDLEHEKSNAFELGKDSIIIANLNNKLERERHFHNFWQKRYYEAVDEQMKLKKENKAPDANTIAENLRLRNELTLAKMKAKEQQRYLEAYQKLYVDEVIKNNNLQKGKSEPEKDSILTKQNCKLLDILTEKIKENVLYENSPQKVYDDYLAARKKRLEKEENNDA